MRACGATQASFRLEHEAIVFEHNGRPFNRDDIEGITGIGNITKLEEANKIGCFGIGFKSVYVVTQRPEVHCTIEGMPIAFRIRDLVVPELIATSHIAATTRIVLPLPSDKAEVTIGKVRDALHTSGPRSLLFLQDLTCLEWTDGSATARCVVEDRLTVGMAPSLARRILMRAILSFRQKYPKIEMVLVAVDDIADIGVKGVDVLIRGRNQRQQGGHHPEPQGVVVRKLFQSSLVVCASPEYLRRAGVPQTLADLPGHACVANFSLERDVYNEWNFTKLHVRKKVKIVPNLLVEGGDALREAGIAGHGIIRIRTCNVDDEIRAHQLVPVLSDWVCTGSEPTLAIYQKTRPMSPYISMFVRHLTEAFRRYNV